MKVVLLTMNCFQKLLTYMTPFIPSLKSATVEKDIITIMAMEKVISMEKASISVAKANVVKGSAEKVTTTDRNDHLI